eukprot:gene31122-35126_t
MDTALDAATPVIHPELGSNLCFHREIDTGGVEAVFEGADVVVEDEFRFGRHTGVTLEPRAVLADFTPTGRRLVVHHSHQAPHMMADLYARQLGLQEADVRVVCRDVGGSFGIKVHAYADDFATVALSVLLGRPVKFVADRLESFVTDVHAREHRVKARLALARDGRMLAFQIDDLTGIGPFSMFPRTSAIEGNQVINITGGPYKHAHYKATLDVAFLNKVQTSQYRGVGHPIACTVTEGLVDLAAAKLGIDPLELRRRNVMEDGSYPRQGASGILLEGLSHQACLDRIETLMDYGALRREQAALRERGDDRIEKRRRLRVGFVIVVGSLALVVIVLEMFFGFRRGNPGIALAQAAATLIATAAMGVALLQSDPDLLFDPAQPEPVPAPSFSPSEHVLNRKLEAAIAQA